MALEFRNSNGNEKFAHLFPQKSGSTSVVRTSQILASVPDKARPEAPNDLSSQYPLLETIELSKIFFEWPSVCLLYCFHKIIYKNF